MTTDLDQSGNGYQQVRVFLGPSLGWTMQAVKRELDVTAAGSTTITPGSSLILVNCSGLVTLLLPDVTKWVQENAYLPATGFERAVIIKDIGGHAAAFNITVTPFGAQKIDGLAQSFTIVQNRQLLRLFPLNDQTGWASL